jgi:AbrB family looped-hinge helix DNA binding protein
VNALSSLIFRMVEAAGVELSNRFCLCNLQILKGRQNPKNHDSRSHRTVIVQSARSPLDLLASNLQLRRAASWCDCQRAGASFNYRRPGEANGNRSHADCVRIKHSGKNCLTMQTKVSAKGQVVLPGPLRRRLDIGAGDPLDANICRWTDRVDAAQGTTTSSQTRTRLKLRCTPRTDHREI